MVCMVIIYIKASEETSIEIKICATNEYFCGTFEIKYINK